MKKLAVAILSLIAALVPLGSALGATASKGTVAEIVDTELSKLMATKRAVGAVASVVQNGEVVLCKGYGYADKARGVKTDGETTAFRIGSISKTFVALAAMQLSEKGRLDMNAPITEYLERDFPAFRYPPTMQELLTHTAGFEEMIAGLFIAPDAKPKALGSVLRDYRPHQAFRPREVTSYSNYGVALAGYVVERIAGEPFYDYARQRIFEPLKMHHSSFRQDSYAAPTLSKPYASDGSEQTEARVNHYPAGSMTATARDMAKYMAYLMSGNKPSVLADERSRLRLFEKQFSMDREFSGIGYTWVRLVRNGHLSYVHDGGTDHFSSLLALYPEEGVGVFVSCSTKDFDSSGIYTGVTESLYGKRAAERQPTGVDATDISGSYIPTRSAFESREKFLNVLKTIRVSGNPAEGFTLNGSKLAATARNHYQAKGAEFAFIQKNGAALLAIDPTQSYLRVPWREGAEWQLLVLALFTMCSGFGPVASTGLLIRYARRKERRGRPSTVAPIVHTMVSIAYGLMVLQVLPYAASTGNGMVGFDNFLQLLHVAALAVGALGVCAILSTIDLWRRKRSLAVRLGYSVWSLAIALFISWLFQVNLLW